MLIQAIMANLLWGMMPLYYYFLGDVSPVLLLSFQIAGTFGTLALYSYIRGEILFPSNTLQYLPTAFLISCNWIFYMIAVLGGRVLEASYAYMIMPIITVMVGAVILKEELNLMHKIGVLICSFSVVTDAVSVKAFPLLSFFIALPFSLYVILHKKRGTTDVVGSLRSETALMTPFVIALGVFLLPSSTLGEVSYKDWFLLLAMGLVNATPLLLFVKASRNLRAVELGVCQFIAPITAAILALALFNSHINPSRIASFVGMVTGMGFVVFARSTTYAEQK
ncbi:EamA family transporter [Kushneria aurantia]|uniref:EamA family transporter n=1 Tax=Kushneria aurantia TaxID=504092 RepID=A0ABV6G2F6_9GAMM|nr:EamA family transporter [Kushneria aurantia]